MSADLVEAIRACWSWSGIEPQAVLATSPFGHLIVRDTKGAFWYLDPEVRELSKVATDEADLIRHMSDPEVREIWEAEALVARANAAIGTPGPGRCYSLSIHALLQGNYKDDDFWHPPVAELIAVMGDIERQTRDLPDGSPVQLKVID